MFVRMDLSLKYSQKRNLFHFFQQKKTKFSKAGGLSRSPPIYAPVAIKCASRCRKSIAEGDSTEIHAMQCYHQNEYYDWIEHNCSR